MKAYKTSKTYKEEYKSWTQPVFSSNELTENGVWYKLTVSAGESTAWKAFDGDTTTNQRCWWTGKVSVSESKPAWICLECDHKLKLTSVDIMNEKYQPENPKTGFIQASNDGVNWKNVGTFAGTNKASYVTTVPLDVTEGYRFYRCYFTATWGEGVSLQEITYHGQIATETRQSNIKVLTVTEKRTIKVDLDKEPNFIKVGSPTISKGVMSGFSKTNYALIPSVPSNVKSYEMVAKFTTGALDGTRQGILANSVTNRCTPQICISTSNLLGFDHPQDADTWVSCGGVSAEPNTTYWIKAVWDGSYIYFYYKTSATSEWTYHRKNAVNSVYWTEQVGIGIDLTSLPFKGSIDLNECYIRINDQMWWSANRDVIVCKMVKGD